MLHTKEAGFTIVELLIVVAVIGVLAAISLVTYTGIQTNASEAVLKSDLQQASRQLDILQVRDGAYPDTLPDLTKSDGTDYEYTSTGDSYCLTAFYTGSADVSSFYISNVTGAIQEGICDGHTASGGDSGGSSTIALQTITTENCPTERTMAVDARDNHTYWIQKLDDGKCWMLTNLAYGGDTSNDGTDEHGDTKTLINGASVATWQASSYTESRYYVVPDTTNYTINPTSPSESSDGTGQYGYLYNWCAAMGAPIASDPSPSRACTTLSTGTLPDPNRSICPAGWRLPTGGYSGELKLLNNAINDGSTTSNAGLRSTWLAQYSGGWASGLNYTDQGSRVRYWSSTMGSNGAHYANTLLMTTSAVEPDQDASKNQGFAVRCVTL